MIEFNRLAENVYKLYSTADRLDPYNIEGLLNKAQDQLLKDKYLSFGNPQEIVYRINDSYDELSDLIKIDNSLTLTSAEDGYGSYAKKVSSMPDDYLYYVRSSTKLTRTLVEPVTDEWVGNNVVGLTSLLRSISGGGNYPIIINPVIYLVEGNVYIVYDAYTTIDSISLMYLKVPDKLDLESDNECELPEHWHYDVADYAVKLYLFNQKEESKEE
jgi:hypothetical protein